MFHVTESPKCTVSKRLVRFSEFGGIVWPTAQSVDRQPFSHSRKIQVQFSKPRTNIYEGLRSEPTKLKKSHD